MQRAFEDFQSGQTIPLADLQVSAGEVAAFDGAYGVPGDSHANPWHVTSLFMRMLFDGWLKESLCLGSPGIERLEWPNPVSDNDRLSGTSTVLDCRPLRSRPTMGLLRIRHEVRNAAGDNVLTMDKSVLMERRMPGEPAPAIERTAAPTAPDGAGTVLGTHRFDAGEITRFAAAYDPQAFHLDGDAAAATHFGALCASGWHTAATHHRLWIAHRTAHPEAWPSGAAQLRRVTDLRWSRPVFAGDTITYRSAPQAGPDTQSCRHWAVNRAGETVFSYVSN